jgi:glycosyltransferase involved in cell wall biosynthesis
LGVAGRVLANHLLKRGFPGYLLDMDSLQEFPYDVPFSLRRFHLPRRMEKQLAGYGSADKLAVRWEGPLLGHYSYSIINRELCARLAKADGIDLSIRPGDTPFTDNPFTPSSSSSFRSIVERVGKHFPNGAHIHIGNHAHHPFSPPLEGRWVVIQPWDYMSLPVRWVDWIQTQIDEVWVPSHFVSTAFLEAGISAEHVAVVPNGVDVQLYRPEARKVRLDTKKSFKFLFVGGPFWRKGFDILLEAYGKAFTARDDVCLVIKSTPEFWTNAGTRWLAAFRARAAAPEIISIVQSIDQQRMAGLYASCDCLVHPYRAEGFAICIAEGMASGLPVIVTGRGAAMDFCNSNTAYLIPAGLCHMDTKQVDDQPTLDYPSYAEPELDGLLEWMRYVYEHPNKSGVTARAGMNKIKAEFTWDHAAEIAIQRLTALSDKPIQRMKRN